MNLDGAHNERNHDDYVEASDADQYDDWSTDLGPEEAELLGDGITATEGDGDELDDDVLDSPIGPTAGRGENTDDAQRTVEPGDARPGRGNGTRVIRQGDDPGLVRIRATKEPVGDDDTEYDKPRVGSVVAAAKRGATMRYELSRDAEGGPIKIVVSRELKPPEAEVEDVEPSEPAEGPARGRTESGQSDPWVRFERHDIQPAEQDKETPAATAQRNPLDVKDLLEGYDGPFKLVMKATGIPRDSDEFTKLFRTVRDDAHNSGIYDGEELDVGIQAARLQKIVQAAGTALVRVEVAVTAPEEDLYEVSSLVEGALPADQRSNWAAERDRSKHLIGYDSEQDALQAGNDDPAKYPAKFVEARDFRDSIKYPDVETEGLQRVRRQQLSVEQDLPPDTRSFRIGQRLDNLFGKGGIRRIAGELVLPVKDLLRHTLVIGRTNSGKTEFTRQLISNAKADNYFRREAGENIPVMKLVTINFKKGGERSDFGQPLADRLASTGLPEGMATVDRIRPGEGGLRPILDLCNPKNSTPVRQAERIINSVLIGVSSGVGAGMSGADGETQRILERYIKDGVIAAYEELGWSMEVEQPDYPNGTPPHPTMGLIAHKIREVFDEKSYDDKAKGNLSEFNAGQFENQLKLLPGRFFRDGHPIDFDEVLDSEGVTAFEFDELGSNDTARKIAAVGIIQEIEKVVDARHAALGIGMVDEVEVLITLDEAAKIFDMTPAGETTSEFLTRLRDKGIAFVISQQIVEGMNPTALKNIGNVFAMQSAEAEQIVQNKLMGEATVEDLAYLNSREVKTTRGIGLAYVAGVNGPVRFQSARTSELPVGHGTVGTAKHLVEFGPYNREYAGETIAKAGRFLNERRAGSLVTAWAEINVALVLSGREPAQVSGKLRQALVKMPETDVRDAAVIEAVRNAVDSRSEAMHLMPPDPRERLTSYLINKMLTQVRGGTIEDVEVRFDLCLDHGYYSRVKDVVENMITAPKLPDTEAYEAFFGNVSTEILDGTPQEIKISGASAREQKSNLEKLELESVKAIRDVVVAGSKRTISRAETQRAQTALVRLIGTGSNKDGVRYVLEKLKLQHDQVETFDNIRKTLIDGREVAPGELEQRLIDAGANQHNILAMRRAIDAAIEHRREITPALDLSKWTTAYGGQDFSVPSGLAKDQEALIERLEAQRMAKCEYKDDVQTVDLIIAADMRNGGLAIDNAVAALAARRQIQGRVYRTARRVMSDNKETKLTIVDQAKELKVDDWANVAGSELLYGKPSNFRYTKGAKRFLVRQVNDYVRELRLMGEKAKAKQKRQGNKAA